MRTFGCDDGDARAFAAWRELVSRFAEAELWMLGSDVTPKKRGAHFAITSGTLEKTFSKSGSRCQFRLCRT